MYLYGVREHTIVKSFDFVGILYDVINRVYDLQQKCLYCSYTAIATAAAAAVCVHIWSSVMNVCALQNSRLMFDRVYKIQSIISVGVINRNHV